MTAKTGLHKWLKRGFMALLSLTIITLVIVISQTTTTTNSDTQQTILAQFDPSTYPELNSPTSTNASKALLIPAADFNADSNNNFVYSFDGGYIRATGSGSACLMAPAYLPSGATISHIVVFVYDNHTSDFEIQLRRKMISSTAASEVIGSIITSGASTAVQIMLDLSITEPVVNSSYAYYVSGCLGATTSEHRLYAVLIYYS